MPGVELPGVGSLSPDDRVRLEECLHTFNRAWRQTDEPPVADFVAGLEDPLRLRVLVELIKRDQHFRWRAGMSLSVEQYLATWPALADNATARRELLETECRERATSTNQQFREEVARRFPAEAALLPWSTIQAVAGARRRQDSLDGQGRFLAIRRLGEGGMGVVHDALDCDRQSRVAVKQLPRVSPSRLYRFKQEFRSLADLRHPHLVELHELYSDGDQWLLIMELVDGVDFFSWTRRNPAAEMLDGASTAATTAAPTRIADEPPRTPLGDAGDAPGQPVAGELPESPADIPRTRQALRQLVEGVEYLHQHGVLHRDLKPGNVLVRRDGRVQILDFGLVAELTPSSTQREHDHDDGNVPQADSHYTREGQIVGTLKYMAPEQVDSHDLGPAADWYSVGVMLFHALTGQVPFGGHGREILDRKRRQPAPAVDGLVRGALPDLVALCRDLLRTDPRRRPTGAEVLARLAGDNPAYARLPRATSIPFVGREAELNRLRHALRTVRDGAPVTLTVHGMSGVGKTSLLARFLDHLGKQDAATVLAGRCFEQESVPFKAVDTLIDALVKFLMRQDRREVEKILPLGLGVDALSRMFPVFQSVNATLSRPPRRGRDWEPHAMRLLASRALRQLLTNLSKAVPLVVLIDDLQWGDVDSATLLADLLRPPDAPCMLTLLCSRDEYARESQCLRRLREADARAEQAGAGWHDMPVQPLSPDEARDLASRLLVTAEARTAEIAQRIETESGGNPYFVIELSRFCSEQTQPGSRSLDEMLWQRFQSLPSEPRALVEVVVTAGQPIQLRQALDAARIAHGQRHVVADLRAQHFLRGSGPGLGDHIEAYHDRIREAVLAKLPHALLRERHAALADAMETGGQYDLETLAVHLSKSGQETRAVKFFAQAADQAVRALAFERAARLYRRCLDAEIDSELDRLELRVKLADALANAGRGRSAGEMYQQAAELVPSRDQRLDLRRRAATQYCLSGHIEQGREVFRDLLRAYRLRFPNHQTARIAWLLWQRLKLRVRGLSFKTRTEDQVAADDLRRIDLLWAVSVGLAVPEGIAVAALQTKGLLLALKAGEPTRLARALACEAFLTGSAGWPAERPCADLIQRARQLAARHGDARGQGMAELSESMVALLQMRFRDTQKHGEKAERIFTDQCTGVWWEIATARTLITWSLWHRGEYIELAKRTSQFLSDARTRGDLYAVTNLESVAQAFLRLAADDLDGARSIVQHCLEAWGGQGFHLQHLSALYTRTHILLYQGKGRQAYEHVRGFWPELRRSFHLSTQLVRHTMYDLRARTCLAAAAEANDPAALCRAARADARRLRRETTPWPRAYAELHLAGVALLRSQPEAAGSHLRDAIAGFETLDQRFHAAAARRLLGRLVSGNAGAALDARGLAEFEAQGIRNPHCFTKMLTFGNLWDRA